MRFHRFLNLVLAFAAASALGVLLGAGGNAMDRRDAQRAFTREMQAAQHCREAYGDASFTFTASGELVCIPRHGKAVADQSFNQE